MDVQSCFLIEQDHGTPFDVACMYGKLRATMLCACLGRVCTIEI
jgi:hypothetical protein